MAGSSSSERLDIDMRQAAGSEDEEEAAALIAAPAASSSSKRPTVANGGASKKQKRGASKKQKRGAEEEEEEEEEDEETVLQPAVAQWLSEQAVLHGADESSAYSSKVPLAEYKAALRAAFPASREPRIPNKWYSVPHTEAERKRRQMRASLLPIIHKMLNVMGYSSGYPDGDFRTLQHGDLEQALAKLPDTTGGLVDKYKEGFAGTEAMAVMWSNVFTASSDQSRGAQTRKVIAGHETIRRKGVVASFHAAWQTHEREAGKCKACPLWDAIVPRARAVWLALVEEAMGSGFDPSAAVVVAPAEGAAATAPVAAAAAEVAEEAPPPMPDLTRKLAYPITTLDPILTLEGLVVSGVLHLEEKTGLSGVQYRASCITEDTPVRTKLLNEKWSMDMLDLREAYSKDQTDGFAAVFLERLLTIGVQPSLKQPVDTGLRHVDLAYEVKGLWVAVGQVAMGPTAPASAFASILGNYPPTDLRTLVRSVREDTQKYVGLLRSASHGGGAANTAHEELRRQALDGATSKVLDDTTLRQAAYGVANRRDCLLRARNILLEAVAGMQAQVEACNALLEATPLEGTTDDAKKASKALIDVERAKMRRLSLSISRVHSRVAHGVIVLNPRAVIDELARTDDALEPIPAAPSTDAEESAMYEEDPVAVGRELSLRSLESPSDQVAMYLDGWHADFDPDWEAPEGFDAKQLTGEPPQDAPAPPPAPTAADKKAWHVTPLADDCILRLVAVCTAKQPPVPCRPNFTGDTLPTCRRTYTLLKDSLVIADRVGVILSQLYFKAEAAEHNYVALFTRPCQMDAERIREVYFATGGKELTRFKPAVPPAWQRAVATTGGDVGAEMAPEMGEDGMEEVVEGQDETDEAAKGQDDEMEETDEAAKGQDEAAKGQDEAAEGQDEAAGGQDEAAGGQDESTFDTDDTADDIAALNDAHDDGRTPFEREIVCEHDLRTLLACKDVWLPDTKSKGGNVHCLLHRALGKVNADLQALARGDSPEVATIADLSMTQLQRCDSPVCAESHPPTVSNNCDLRLPGMHPYTRPSVDAPPRWVRITRHEPCPLDGALLDAGSSSKWRLTLRHTEKSHSDGESMLVERFVRAPLGGEDDGTWGPSVAAKVASPAVQLTESAFYPEKWPTADRNYVLSLINRFTPGFSHDLTRNSLFNAWLRAEDEDGRKRKHDLDPECMAESLQSQLKDSLTTLVAPDCATNNLLATCNVETSIITEPESRAAGAKEAKVEAPADFSRQVTRKLGDTYAMLFSMHEDDAWEYSITLCRTPGHPCYATARKVAFRRTEARLKASGLDDAGVAANIEGAGNEHAKDYRFPPEWRAALAHRPGMPNPPSAADLAAARRLKALIVKDFFDARPQCNPDRMLEDLAPAVVHKFIKLAPEVTQEAYQWSVNPALVAAVRCPGKGAKVLLIDIRDRPEVTECDVSDRFTGSVNSIMPRNRKKLVAAFESFPLDLLEQMSEYEKGCRKDQWTPAVADGINKWIAQFEPKMQTLLRKVFYTMSSVRSGKGGLCDYICCLSRALYGDTKNAVMALLTGPPDGEGGFLFDSGKSTMRKIHEYIFEVFFGYGKKRIAQVNEQMFTKDIDLTGSKPVEGLANLRNALLLETEEAKKAGAPMDASALKTIISHGEENLILVRRLNGHIFPMRTQFGCLFYYSNHIPAGIEEQSITQKRLVMLVHNYVVMKHEADFRQICALEERGIDWRNPATPVSELGLKDDKFRRRVAYVGIDRCCLPKRMWETTGQSKVAKEKTKQLAYAISFIALCAGWQVKSKRNGVWPAPSYESSKRLDELVYTGQARTEMNTGEEGKSLCTFFKMLTRPALAGEQPITGETFRAAVNKRLDARGRALLSKRVSDRLVSLRNDQQHAPAIFENKTQAQQRQVGAAACAVVLTEEQQHAHGGYRIVLPKRVDLDEKVAFYDMLRRSLEQDMEPVDNSKVLPEFYSAERLRMYKPDPQVTEREWELSLPIAGFVWR